MLSLEPLKYVALSHKFWHDYCVSFLDAGSGQRMKTARVSKLHVRAAPGSRFPLQVLWSDGLPELLNCVCG